MSDQTQPDPKLANAASIITIILGSIALVGSILQAFEKYRWLGIYILLGQPVVCILLVWARPSMAALLPSVMSLPAMAMCILLGVGYSRASSHASIVQLTAVVAGHEESERDSQSMADSSARTSEMLLWGAVAWGLLAGLQTRNRQFDSKSRR